MATSNNQFDLNCPKQLIEEQNLSQTMSQLSTTATNRNECLIKDIKAEIETIPDYLTKRNKSFRQIMYQAISIIKTTAKLDASHIRDTLRKIAILIYKIKVIQTYQLLWTAYLKSGMGQLILPSQTQLSYSTTVSIWPKDIKNLLQINIKDKPNENECYSNFVHDHLSELDQRLKQNQTELNFKMKHFPDDILTIQKIIETYIEHNLQSFRTTIEHQIELIHFDYHIRALKVEYFRYKPNANQKQLMTQICRNKYEQETTEQEYHFLTEQINYYNLPNQSFECSIIAHSSLIESIENPTVRQDLYKQYKEVAEQSKIALFNVYLKSAEEQREEYKKKYEDQVKQMFYNKNEKLPLTMLQLIDQRCHKISERIQCIYKFKIQSIVSISKL